VSTALEIESALKDLPLHEAQKLAHWLQEYLDQKAAASDTRPMPAAAKLPDYAARRRTIMGDKVLPNMIVTGREGERW
jgi:urease accessory protein UreF